MHIPGYPRQTNPDDPLLAPRRPLWLVIALALVGAALLIALVVYALVT